MKTHLWILLLVSSLCLSCSDNGSPGPGPSDFDRSAMLANWADNIIIPSYTNFAEQTDTLHANASIFVENPTPESLDNLRNVWLQAYIEWQHVSMFEIGKAAEVRYRDNMNIYPVDTDELHENIDEGDYNLGLSSENNRQGFPALDYMLFGLGENDAEILSFYTTNADAEAYRSYLMDLVIRMDSLTQEVLSGWTSGYRDEFVDNNGNGANASVDMMVNDFIFYYEKALRAGKVGIPAGVFSGTPLTTHVEAYYKQDISKTLLNESIAASQNFFNGKHANSEETGESLNTYLDFLNTIKNGADLSALINAQFESAKDEAADLDDNFVQQIESDNTAMLQTYDELQKNVVLLKVDMLQALNINVDYVDADGD